MGGVSGADNVGGGENRAGSGAGSGGAADIIASRDVKCLFSHVTISSSVSFSNFVTPDCHPL